MVTMESLGAYKKATAALDEAARARLRGPFVSHAAASSTPPGLADVDDGLVDLVDEFYNGYGEHGADAAVAKAAAAPRSAEWKETLCTVLADAAGDAAAARICAEAERAVRSVESAGVSGAGIRKRLVECLRARGFDAGLCRSSWEKTSSVPAPGTHEYVDVATGSSPWAPSSRYIVEVNVAAEFEIARPSAEYRAALLSLPAVLVAQPDAFKVLAAAMCAAAAECIRGAGMHVPPWRRAPYVQAKWSGQLERAGAGAPAVHAARRPGGRTKCGMETGCREVAMGREALVSVRPLFRGL